MPLAIKIAPDMSDEETVLVASALIESGMDAVIATNTTLSRQGVEGLPHGDEAGGLSGAPVREKARTSSRCWPVSWQVVCRSLPLVASLKAGMLPRR